VTQKSQLTDKHAPGDPASVEQRKARNDTTVSTMRSLFADTNSHITSTKKEFEQHIQDLVREHDAKTSQFEQRFIASLGQSSLSDPAQLAALEGKFKDIIAESRTFLHKAMRSESASVIARAAEETAKVNHHADQIADKMERLELQHYAESKAAINQLNALVESIKKSIVA